MPFEEIQSFCCSINLYLHIDKKVSLVRFNNFFKTVVEIEILWVLWWLLDVMHIMLYILNHSILLLPLWLTIVSLFRWLISRLMTTILLLSILYNHFAKVLLRGWMRMTIMWLLFTVKQVWGGLGWWFLAYYCIWRWHNTLHYSFNAVQ